MDQPLQQYAFTKPGAVEYWDEIYDRNDFIGDRFRQRMEKALAWLDELKLPEHSRILDVGSGTGRLVTEAARRGYDVFGLDYSYEMLIKAAAVDKPMDGSGTPFLQGRIEHLPFKSGNFDVIISLGVIPHVKSPEMALRELARLLKPGGTLIFSFDNRIRLVKRLDLPVLIKRIMRRIENSTGLVVKKDQESGPATQFYPTIRNSLDSLGVKVLEYEAITVELLTVFDHEILPRKLSIPMTLFLDRFTNVPIIGSFGGQCILKAKKCPPSQASLLNE